MTQDAVVEMSGVRVLVCEPSGPPLHTGHELTDLIGNALHQRVDLVLLPVERLPDDFFVLRTGVAGEIVQKFVNYRVRLAVVGDITRHLATSSALRDFVAETNRGKQLWFAATRDEVTDRLGATGSPPWPG
jgi:hypothetical protein